MAQQRETTHRHRSQGLFIRTDGTGVCIVAADCTEYRRPRCIMLCINYARQDTDRQRRHRRAWKRESLFFAFQSDMIWLMSLIFFFYRFSKYTGTYISCFFFSALECRRREVLVKTYNLGCFRRNIRSFSCSVRSGGGAPAVAERQSFPTRLNFAPPFLTLSNYQTLIFRFFLYTRLGKVLWLFFFCLFAFDTLYIIIYRV